MTEFDAPFRPTCVPALARIQFRAATFYLMAGLLLGIVMAGTGNVALKGVHGHIHLLGWVTLALTGAVYAVVPDVAKGALTRWHVILHKLGLPIMLVALTAYLSGMAAAQPAIAVGAVLSTLGLGAFMLAI